MGTSKLLAERVVTAASTQFWNGSQPMIFASTRFGNVLGSNGSVVPIFKKQIKQGGPVTVTHRGMTRFVMTVQEAARLVVKNGAQACGGEVMVTKMPTIRILDLAGAMIEVLSPVYGLRPGDCAIDFTGPKPGEKLYEELMTEEEAPRALELKDMFSILPVFKDAVENISYKYPCVVSNKVGKPYISKDEKSMTRDAIKEYLLANRVLGEDIEQYYKAGFRHGPGER